LCRFFKEFADHESDRTPEFRHPYLKGHYELENINLLEEVSRYQDLYSAQTVKPMRDDEKVTTDNKLARQQLRQAVFDIEARENEADKKPKGLKYYYYKRWLWMQYAWCALDVYSDISSVMSKFASNSDF
jgi:hypothetical protein